MAKFRLLFVVKNMVSSANREIFDVEMIEISLVKIGREFVREPSLEKHILLLAGR